MSLKKWLPKRAVQFELKDGEGEQGIISGTLVTHGTLDSYEDVFLKESLDKVDKSRTYFLLHQHNWEKEIGTLTVSQDETGNLKFTGKLDLTLLENGNPVNPTAWQVYSLMKNNEAKYEMSAGGKYIDAGYGEFETNAGMIKAYLIKEFELIEGSVVLKGAVKDAGVETVKFDKEENKKTDIESEENMSKKIDEVVKEEEEIKETETSEVKEETKEPETKTEDNGDIEKKVNELVEKRLGEEIAKINTDIRKGVSVDMTKIQGEKDLEDYEKAVRTDFNKLDRSTTQILIPLPQSQEILKELKQGSNFFNAGNIVTGQGEIYKFPVRNDDRNNSVEQVAEKTGNAKEGELEYGFIEIGAGVLQNRFIIPDESLADISYDIMGEMTSATVEDFADKLANLTVNGTLSAVNKIEGFLKNTKTESEGTGTAGKVTQNDLIKLVRSEKMNPVYRKTSKLYVSPSLFTEMLIWVDGNGRPLLTPTLTADNSYGYRFMGYDVIEEYYLEEVKTGKFPAFFGDFNKFYTYYVRINTFETERDRNVNERVNLFYTRCRLGGKVIRPKAGVTLQVS